MTNVIERDEMTAAFAEAAETARSGTPEERSGKVLPVGAVSELRQQLGLNRDDFTRRYMVPIGTLQAWERGTDAPDAVAISGEVRPNSSALSVRRARSIPVTMLPH